MTRRALVLLSGGLDGLLAAAVLRSRGVRVRGLHLATGFVPEPRRRSVLSMTGRVETVDVGAPYLDLLRDPPHGFGTALNPCRDCRVLMLREAAGRARAGEIIATGDVVGQRAMDQSRAALAAVDDEAGVTGRVLRPLSAALLPTPSAAPWVRPERWPRLHGRSRRGQRELAARLGVPFAPVPSGGCCRLAERPFARRVRDLLEHHDGRPDADALGRLDRGRHLRLSWCVKLVIARDESEGAWLASRASGCWVAQVRDRRGAVVVVEGRPDEQDLHTAAAAAARYSAHRREPTVAVEVSRDEAGRSLRVAPASDARLADGRL